MNRFLELVEEQAADILEEINNSGNIEDEDIAKLLLYYGDNALDNIVGHRKTLENLADSVRDEQRAWVPMNRELVRKRMIEIAALALILFER